MTPFPRILLCLLAASCSATPEPVERMVDVNGTSLFVETRGEGPAIVVIHGGPMLDHGYLQPWLDPLAEGNTLVYYDQRFNGRSSADAEGETNMAAMVADLEALRVDLGIERFTLVGHSFGGHLAQRYAISHPERLDAMVLLDSVAATTDLWMAGMQQDAAAMSDDLKARLAEFRSSEAVQNREPDALDAMMRAQFEASFSDPSLTSDLELYFPSDYTDREHRYFALASELQGFDLNAGLAALDVPTLVVYGEAETGAEVGGPELRDAIPNAEWVVIEDAGHFPFVEQQQRTLDAIESFLERVER